MPTFSDMNWVQLDTNYLYSANDEEVFGAAVSLSDDGTVVTVGAFLNSERNEGGGRVIRYDVSDGGSASELYGLEMAYLGYQVSTSGVM